MKLTRSLVCVALVLAANAAAAPLTLRLMAQESIAPKWIGQHGKLTGLCPDIIAAMVAAEPGLRIDPHIASRSVPVIEHSLETGLVDAACALLDTPRRQQVARIAGPPVYTVRHKIAGASSDSAAITSLDDLVRLKALVNTSRGSGYVDQLLAAGLQVDGSSGDNAVNLRKILAGHGRFMYMNELTLNWFIRQEKLEDKIKVWPATIKEEPIYFWVSKKARPEVHDLVSRTLDKLQQNGKLASIYQRWSGK
jgi:polar amino acid transport system substrate-binding protein